MQKILHLLIPFFRLRFDFKNYRTYKENLHYPQRFDIYG